MLVFLQPIILVSVPYRGLIFLNIRRGRRGRIKIKPFPSPTGDLYFSILQAMFNSLVSFPSPTGDLYFSIKNSAYWDTESRFRPLPGTYISQLQQRKNRKTRRNCVSVPYRGLIFLNTISAIPCKH